LILTSNRTITAGFRVPGDDFAQRVPIAGTNATATASNVGATKEPGEPDHAGIPGGRSVWWTWTAPASGQVSINTAGTTFPNALAVYTGNVMSNLVPVASDLNSLGPTTSRVSFDAVAGMTYQLAVDGSGGANGNITLNLTPQTVLALVGAYRPSDTQFGFRLISAPGQAVRIEVSDDLINWTKWVEFAHPSGSFLLDDELTLTTNRFYRAVAP